MTGELRKTQKILNIFFWEKVVVYRFYLVYRVSLTIGPVSAWERSWQKETAVLGRCPTFRGSKDYAEYLCPSRCSEICGEQKGEDPFFFAVRRDGHRVRFAGGAHRGGHYRRRYVDRHQPVDEIQLRRHEAPVTRSRRPDRRLRRAVFLQARLAAGIAAGAPAGRRSGG